MIQLNEYLINRQTKKTIYFVIEYPTSKPNLGDKVIFHIVGKNSETSNNISVNNSKLDLTFKKEEGIVWSMQYIGITEDKKYYLFPKETGITILKHIKFLHSDEEQEEILDNLINDRID